MKYFIGLAFGTLLGVLWTKAWEWNWASPLAMLAALWVAAVFGFGLAAVMAAGKRAEEMDTVRRLHRGPRHAA